MLPSVGLALLVLSAILLGLIWPGIVQQFQVKPSEADKEARVHREEHRGHPGGLRPRRRRGGRVASTTTRDAEARRRAGRTQAPPSRWSTRSWSARPSSRTSRRAPTTRWPTCSTSTATRSAARTGRWCSVPASSTRAGLNEDDQNWINLHTVYTHGNGVIAAYANQRDADDHTPRAATSSGPTAPSGPRATQPTRTDLEQGRRRLRETGSTSASRAPTTPSSARSTARTRPGRGARPRRRRPSGERGRHHDVRRRRRRPVGSTFRQLLYAIKFGEPNFLLSGRVQLQQRGALQPRPRASGSRRSRRG